MAKTQYQGLRVRKLADKSQGERVPRLIARSGVPLPDGSVMIDPAECERILFNPATPDLVHEPWPLAGVAIEGETPRHCMVSTAFVNRGVSEGWVELENSRMAHRPGGPPDDPWRLTHTFKHADAVVLKCVDGDVRYRVVHQPDKYDVADDEALVTDERYAAGATRVDWLYKLELEA